MARRQVSFSHRGGQPVLFPREGFYESLLYDAGQELHWNRLAWEEDLEADTESTPVERHWPSQHLRQLVHHQRRQSAAEHRALNGRYARFQARLTTDGKATPKFGNVNLSFSGEWMQDNELRTYQYDEAGNIEMVTTVTDAGSSTDVRTHNDLNQLEEQVVGGDTWTFSYDDNGNMTGKNDGTDTWSIPRTMRTGWFACRGLGVSMFLTRTIPWVGC